MIGQIELLHFRGPEELAAAAAERWLGPTAPIVRHLALSGGRIARLFLAAAARIAVANVSVSRSLQQTTFFWADERCVPPTHPESNYQLAREAFFDPLDFPSLLVHRVKGELPPDQAVREANEEITRIVPRSAAGIPRLDLVFLGMGEDGHIASLFPGSEDAQPSESPYAVVVGPKPPNPRITLTYELLAAAREVWVLVSGDEKELILRNSIEGKALTPLSRLIRLRKSTLLLTDRFF